MLRDLSPPMIVTFEDILRDLRALGLGEGDGVCVHASLGAIGLVVGGARAVVSALIEAVGSDGLIAMPAFSTDAYPAGGTAFGSAYGSGQ